MAAESKTRNCPFCKEEIKADAILCKHCHSRLAPEKPTHGGTCPYCKEAIHPEAIKCKHCLSSLGPKQGCERCGPLETAAGFMARQRPTGGGGGGGSTCETRWMACTVDCYNKYGALIGTNDPLMLQACLDSCDAALRLCRTFRGSGIGGGGIVIF